MITKYSLTLNPVKVVRSGPKCYGQIQTLRIVYFVLYLLLSIWSYRSYNIVYNRVYVIMNKQ
jgi:hypothetical protein